MARICGANQLNQNVDNTRYLACGTVVIPKCQCGERSFTRYATALTTPKSDSWSRVAHASRSRITATSHVQHDTTDLWDEWRKFA